MNLAKNCCHHTECNEVYFESDYVLPINLDGEIIETNRMSFGLVKGGLNFIMPKGLKIEGLSEKVATV